MKKRLALVLGILIIAVLILAVYFTFFFTRKCSDINCFNSALVKCKKASYIDDAEDGTWLYKIKGKSEEECKINVELLQLKQGTNEMKVLEGKDMDCYIQLGTMTSPQSNLAKCHGLLKEEMQNVIINRLHNYIVSNLGQISEELEKPL